MGTRLGSPVPKLLHPVSGRPMLDYLFELYGDVVERFVLVIHPSFETPVREFCNDRSIEPDIVFQPSPSGMLPAILLPRNQVSAHQPDSVWVTWCDQVGIHPRTVERLAQTSESRPQAALTFPTAWKPGPYIHFVRDEQGAIIDVLQKREGDAMPSSGESDSGLFCLSRVAYLELLLEFTGAALPGARTGESNFLPFIPWVAKRDVVRTFPVEHELESVGINTLDDVKTLEGYLRERR
jgi:bifunctional UDP-N-acetylglucosamine pyrophosphorylase/glucosamine-1-phosphate N-acetyltransferase